ncbi:glutaminase [Neobacillus ginsengisoli]|uniref:Glutaminase n=2 Tax=Neobacillus ginsengisoli TaxID=904295 RepID=A0ABT9XQZ4_9BACI|nr:glutaminase [Neobacillus ginsengisoli]
MKDMLPNEIISKQQQLDEMVLEFKNYTANGATASYIPALKKADPNDLGICMISSEGTFIKSGDAEKSFTLQSISKVISFILACKTRGIPSVLEYVDVEPTGDAFNSIFRLELSHPGRPFNPMINAGAITVASLLPGDSPTKKIDSLLSFLEKMIGRKPMINEDVFLSEWKTANRNRSLAYWLKETGYLLCDVEEAMEVYLKLCSIEMTVSELAQIGLILARDGIHPYSSELLFSPEIASLTKTLMLTCGMYDYSGRFAAFVGIPAKSGVSGGILAAIPPSARVLNNRSTSWGIGLYGPAIDKHGNSTAGVKLLTYLSKEWNLRLL